jgi:LysR family transcriptional regulator of abg operon
MEPMRRLSQVWSWLPAFRAVAETQHLPTAARILGVSAPALSRAVRLLEDRLGTRLFERRQRRLVLNQAGAAFLATVRNGMRQIDDGWDLATHAETIGTVQIGLGSDSISYRLAPQIAALRRAYPRLVPHLLRAEPAAVVASLREGALDLALTEQADAYTSLRVEKLTVIRHRLYCGERHPLAGARRPSRDRILAHDFIVPSVPGADRWPPEIPRKVGVIADSLTWATALCATGRWLGVFPESVEAIRFSGQRLRRLAFAPSFPGSAIYAASREPLGGISKVDLVLAIFRSAAVG